MKLIKSFSAFTLAEVLITLAIIGVVAAVTIPSLVNKYQERVKITKLKKAYSVLMNAYNLAIAEHGTLDNWNLENTESEVDENGNSTVPDEGLNSVNSLWTNLLPYMKVDQICLAGNSNCSIFKNNTKIYSLSGRQNSDLSQTKFLAIRLDDGTILWGGFIGSASCSLVRGQSKQLQNVCADFGIIVGGSGKDKYYVGKEIFYVYLTKNSIVPLGTNDNITRPFPEYCNPNIAGAAGGQYNGYGCAAWVLTKGNMDYLRRDDLDW